MSRSEKSVQNDALVAVSALPETMCWRNNTGTAWQGERLKFYPGTEISVPPGIVVLRNPRPISFGLPGSGDILGASCARPVAIEMKATRGTQSEQQERFERAWVRAGGLYILARSAEEAVTGLRLQAKP